MKTDQTQTDYRNPVRIAEDIWWVGRVLENDPFQCHVYLLENGENSVLLDPGSKLTWPETRRKILQRMPLQNIRYIVCHHQDPDITSAVGDLLEEIGTENRLLVTHWRAQELLEHYDWGIDFYDVSAHDWRLDIGGRELRFVFTPYMHFPGNFCTFDTRTRTLFSSDIFGGITEKFSLFAEDADSYFEQMRPFHTHYMPAREIVNRGLDEMQKYEPIESIAPQHGSIIRRELIAPIMEKLRGLECGIFLEFGGSRQIEMMSRVNEILPLVFETAAYFDTFQADFQRMITFMNRAFPLKRIFVLSLVNDEYYIKLDSDAPTVQPCDLDKETIESRIGDVIFQRKSRFALCRDIGCLKDPSDHSVYLFPLVDYEAAAFGVGMFVFDTRLDDEKIYAPLLTKFEKAIAIVAKREIEVYKIEDETRRVYNMAITDQLTKVYNRHYFDEVTQAELTKSKRYDYPVALLYLDLDHFKKVNDRYGHDVGDIVLKYFAELIKKNLRESDMAFRLGGEEFAVLMPYADRAEARIIADRLRQAVHDEGCIEIGVEKIFFTFSGGISDNDEAKHSIELMLKIADGKLYKAKETGRDRVVS